MSPEGRPLHLLFLRSGGVPPMNLVHHFRVCIVLVGAGGLSMPAAGQEPARSEPPGIQPLAQPEARQPGGEPASSTVNQQVKPLMEGPLHEAFLSPRK